jgi:hypothetical protein
MDHSSNNDYDLSHLQYYPVVRHRQKRQHGINTDETSDIQPTTISISSSSNETPPRRTFSLRLRQRLSKLIYVPISKANVKQRQSRKEQRQQQVISSKKTSKSFISKSIQSSSDVPKTDENDPTNFVVILLEDENYYDNENEMGVVVLSKSSSASQLSTSRFKSGTTIALADDLTVTSSSSSSGLSSHVDIPTLHPEESHDIVIQAKSNEIGIIDSSENPIDIIKSTENPIDIIKSTENPIDIIDSTENPNASPEELGIINQNNVQPYSPSINCNDEVIMTLKKLILTRSKPDFSMFMSCWLPSNAATTKTDIPKTAFQPCTKDCILHNIMCSSEMMIPPAIMAAQPKTVVVSETTTTAAEYPSSISVPKTESSFDEKKVAPQPSKEGEEEQILPIFLARPFGDKDFTSLFSLAKTTLVTTTNTTTTSIPRTILWNQTNFKDMSDDEINIIRQISSLSGSSSEDCSVVTKSASGLNQLHPIENHPLVSSGVIQKEEEEGHVFRQISEIYFEESSIIPNHHDYVDLSLAEAVAAVQSPSSPLALEDQQSDVVNDPSVASIF